MARVVRLEKSLPATWEEALRDFLFYKQAQGVSETTVNDYNRFVRRFFNRYPDAFEQSKLKPAILEFMAQRVKPVTFNLRLIYLRAFFEWCIKEGILSENPLAEFKQRKTQGRVVNIDTETLIKLISMPNTKTFAGMRDYALILLTLDTGIRPKEAFSLLTEDINFRALEVYVRDEVAKTRTARTLPISPPTANAIRNLIKARHPDWKATLPIFCSAEGTRLKANTWGDRLEMYSKSLGIKVVPYDLRHAFALEYLRNGGDALSLQRIMGHTTLAMTRRYVALTQGDLKRQYATASPLKIHCCHRSTELGK